MSDLSYSSAKVHCQMAMIWQLKGKIERAMEGYQQALSLEADYLPAYEGMAKLMLKQQKTNEALEYYDRALTINFNNTNLSDYYSYLGWSPHISQPNSNILTPPLNNNPNGKINLGSQKTFHFHRSGWNYAINALQNLHNSRGTLFDGFLENNFLWKYPKEEIRPPRILEKMRQDDVFKFLANSVEQGIIPYTEPWVGFIHNPPKMPIWFSYKESPQMMFNKKAWQDSLEHCVGLFALSKYHAEWIKQQTGKPVSILYHPTEIPDVQFDFNKFVENSNKKIVQIGWWLRKLNAIYQLPIAKDNALKYEKIRLIPLFSKYADQHIRYLMNLEKKIYHLNMIDEFLENTVDLVALSNQEYDLLLSENIVFVELYDSSANNAVIECIARGTPLLVNPLPSVVEYLGTDYPMYFSTLEEAAEKAMNLSLIWDTHQYLKNSEVRNKLSAEYFLKSFQESEVYQMI